ncbi:MULTISPECIES: permease [unclassified Pseudofrankia]|uniref:permease n=1 Tax=unclassified Pseudofrankia TaxID=2994372 RepID=UPI0009F592D6|nr:MULTISPECIES: permease [unclassified Pseudofrankia]MDT3444102.1 permease [Pseudofrankia sp. BMG5.37]
MNGTRAAGRRIRALARVRPVPTARPDSPVDPATERGSAATATGAVSTEAATENARPADAAPVSRPGATGRPGIPVVALVALAAVAVPLVLRLVHADTPGVRAWCTVFLAVTIQALPFLALGVLVSGAVAAFVPDGALGRVLPRRGTLAVPVAGVCGAFLPGCECSSVPVAKRLADNGAPPAAALTFMLAAPAINPVVLVATAVAFPNAPRVVVARFLASLLAAIVVGLVWHRFGTSFATPVPGGRHHEHAGRPSRVDRLNRLAEVAGHDFLHAGGFLVLGAGLAATLNVAVPRSALSAVADAGFLTVLALAALAVALAICSEADAFVAASMSQFPLSARLAFLVVGPMVDVKLVAMQAGTFGRRVALRFAPLTFLAALLSAVVVGEILL